MKARALAGVNLGGWLVLEKWITPSLFAGTHAIDEYTFCKLADKKERKRLAQFRDTFITKKDFEWMAGQGIETVRLPVGYWLFGDLAPYEPTVSYVDKAFAWAKTAGIKILIDLHAAPGSQNGRDHSGQQGNVMWHRDAENIEQTLQIIQKIAKRYGKNPALLGISLLNEPSRNIPKAILLSYYEKAYEIIRDICGEDTWIVYSDGFAPAKWRKELPRQTFKNVFIDRHHYQVFSPVDKNSSSRLNLWRARWQLPITLAKFRRYHPVIIGEWSLTLSGKDLRGRSPAERQKILQTYANLQLRAYQKSAAWFYWTYKTENAGTWSFRDCYEKGLLPKSLDRM